MILNHTPKAQSSVVRALIGRYLWRVGRDIWIWPKASMRMDLVTQLNKIEEKNFSVEMYWKDSAAMLGFSYEHLGSMPPDRNALGLFLHTNQVFDSGKPTDLAALVDKMLL